MYAKCLSLCAATFIIALAISPRVAQASPVAHLELWSQEGDYVGQGGHYDLTYTPENSTMFWANAYRYGDGFGRPNYLEFSLGTVTADDAHNTWAYLLFSTQQLDESIRPGLFLEAQRAPFESPGHPGLDINFQNRGCDAISGSFVVEEASFSPVHVIQHFRARFVQHCEAWMPALVGTFDYSATSVPEPATVGMIGGGLLLIVAAARARRPRGNTGAGTSAG